MVHGPVSVARTAGPVTGSPFRSAERGFNKKGGEGTVNRQNISSHLTVSAD